MAEEQPPIVVPAALAKAYSSARIQGDRINALHGIINDKEVWDDICEDCCKIIDDHHDRAQAVQFALVDAMGLTCPCRQDMIKRRPRQLSCDEITNGKCAGCGAKIVIEGAQ